MRASSITSDKSNMFLPSLQVEELVMHLRPKRKMRQVKGRRIKKLEVKCEKFYLIITVKPQFSRGLWAIVPTFIWSKGGFMNDSKRGMCWPVVNTRRAENVGHSSCMLFRRNIFKLPPWGLLRRFQSSNRVRERTDGVSFVISRSQWSFQRNVISATSYLVVNRALHFGGIAFSDSAQKLCNGRRVARLTG